MSSCGRERESASSLLWSHHQGLPLLPSSWHNYLPKVPSPNTITLGIRASTYTFYGDRIQSIVTFLKYLTSLTGLSLEEDLFLNYENPPMHLHLLPLSKTSVRSQIPNRHYICRLCETWRCSTLIEGFLESWTKVRMKIEFRTANSQSMAGGLWGLSVHVRKMLGF